MVLFKVASLYLMLTACITSSMMASEEVMFESSPNTPRFNNNISYPQSPIKRESSENKRLNVVTAENEYKDKVYNQKQNYNPYSLTDTLSPLMPQKSCKILEIDHPLEEYELVQLKDRDYKEIYLHSVYIGYEESGIFVKKTSLTISPEVVNPEVEVLSLKCCGITDTLIKGIEEFMALRKLVLFSNHITDASVISAISQLKSLKSLSLINEEISNASVPAVLAMPNLTELDLSHNERINDEIAETLFKHTNLKKLNVRFTGLTRQQQRRLENKYKDLNGK